MYAFHVDGGRWGFIQEVVEQACFRGKNLLRLNQFGETSYHQVVPSPMIVQIFYMSLEVLHLQGVCVHSVVDPLDG